MHMRLVKLLLLFFSVVLLVLTMIVATAETVDMEKVNVSWDLEPEKPVSIYTRFSGLEYYVPIKITLTNVQKGEDKQGRSTISFTLVKEMDFTPTDDEIRRISAHTINGTIGGDWAWCVVDYDTGMSLEPKKNNKGVVVSYKEGKSVKEKLSTKDKKSIQIGRKGETTITIAYPKEYNGLCFGVLGKMQAFGNNTEDKFFAGSVPFSLTIYHDSGKADLSHFMRISAIE